MDEIERDLRSELDRVNFSPGHFLASLGAGLPSEPIVSRAATGRPPRYRGRPSMRSPMIVRWTSLVPPAIDAAFDHSH